MALGVVVSDNASTDNTPEMVDAMRQKFALNGAQDRNERGRS